MSRATKPARFEKGKVVFLNPRTCGIYKNGSVRYKVNVDGQRTKEVENELLEHVEAFVSGKPSPGAKTVPLKSALSEDVLVPRYYDDRWDLPFDALKAKEGFDEITLGELEQQGILLVRGGHGSPGNDQRVGHVPYIKVSDIRNLRVNVNPTNLVPLALARRLWRSTTSGLQPWDLISPNRASSNIGEFAIFLPGEENVVLTKEMFVFRIVGGAELGWDPFYLLWCLSLKSVRMQWQRVTLMQTNREDVGDRYKEVRIPKPKSKTWAMHQSRIFRAYFTALGEAKAKFQTDIGVDGYDYIATVLSVGDASAADDDGVTLSGGDATIGEEAPDDDVAATADTAAPETALGASE